MGYDRAITVFSPDGHLFQVEYALEAVRKGAVVVGYRGKDFLILATEKKSVHKLQEHHTVRKIVQIDEGRYLAFAGLTADARVLVNRARLECQNYRLNLDESPSVDYITRFIASTQQKYTQRGGVRPFGVSTLIIGFSERNGEPLLFQTDPSGMWSQWKACTIGGSNKAPKEFLEANYKEDATLDQAIEITLKTILEVVESKNNIDVALLRKDSPLKFLSDEETDNYLSRLE